MGTIYTPAFLDYIYNLWTKIGHNPSEPVAEESLARGHKEDTQDHQEAHAGYHSQDPSQFTGVSIKNFSKDHGEIVEFLIDSGLKLEDVTISDVDNVHCQELITPLHMSKVPGDDKMTLKCNGIIPYTPTKPGRPPVAQEKIASVSSVLEYQT